MGDLAAGAVFDLDGLLDSTADLNRPQAQALVAALERAQLVRRRDDAVVPVAA